MKRVVKLVAISLGAVLAVLIAAGVLFLVAVNYRTVRKHSDLVQLLAKKVAPITAKPEILWDTTCDHWDFPKATSTRPI